MAKQRRFTYANCKTLGINSSIENLSLNCHKKPVEIFMGVVHVLLMSINLQSKKQLTQGAHLMNHIATRIAATALLAALSVASTYAGGIAQPAGILTVPVVGPNKVNLLATPFALPADAEGTISAQSGSVLTVSSVPTMTAGRPYILEVQDGDFIGAIGLITASTENTVTVQYAFPADSIAAGTRYSIRPDWTISSLLGSAATSKFGSSTSYGGGDVLQIFNPVSQKFENFWRRRTGTSPNFQYAWLTQAGVAAENTRIPLGEGFIIKRFSSTQLNLVLSGELRQARTRKEILGNAKLNVVANPNPYPVKLTQSGLLPLAGTSLTQADKVHFINPATGKFVSYFRKSDGAWYNAQGNAASTDLAIAAGGAIVYQRTSGGNSLTGRSAIKLNPIAHDGAPGI